VAFNKFPFPLNGYGIGCLFSVMGTGLNCRFGKGFCGVHLPKLFFNYYEGILLYYTANGFCWPPLGADACQGFCFSE
jgi:hypothetical protein